MNTNGENTKDEKGEATQPQSGYGILLVDDDRFLLDMYSMKFANAGHTVQACLSAQEAIEALEHGFEADAIVFDLVMPEEDGFTLLRTLKEKELAPNAVRIALTNQGADEERQKTEELGTHEYIVKASTVPSEVVNIIIQAIEAHRAT